MPTNPGMAVMAAKPLPLSLGSRESARRADEAGNLKTRRPFIRFAKARNLQSGASMKTE